MHFPKPEVPVNSTQEEERAKTPNKGAQSRNCVPNEEVVKDLGRRRQIHESQIRVEQKDGTLEDLLECTCVYRN